MVMLQQQHSRCKFRCRIDQREWELPKRWDQAVKGLIMERGGVGELVIVNTEKGAFGLPDLMKSFGRSAWKWRNGVFVRIRRGWLMVVVKRTREMNTLSKDEFDAEIRKLGRLHHANILTPLAFHYQPDEKPLVIEDRHMLNSTGLFVSRLFKELPRDWAIYLHTKLASSHLPHGNLKSSNLFLSDDSEPCIAFRIWSSSPDQPSNVGSSILFGYKAPEAAQHGVSPMCDVYCLGIIIVLEILTGKFPSQYLNNAKGGTDVVQRVESAISDGRETELLDPEIASSTNSLGQMRRLLGIGAACVERNPEQRLNITDAIQMIQDIKLERTIQALPSLRDG
ncbi:hypothetical protein OIU76_018267 [Salix suchowensis]|nr:hypothetical protein OIU76_018267 [Salix suchowensis]